MSEIWQWQATQIAQAIRDKKISAREATESALKRLADVNPRINAVVQEFPEQAIADAQALDKAIADGHTPGPLAGVPITTKVNVDQAGCATTNGIRLQKDLIAQRDNPVVANLRNAGAIIIGRSNTPAFSVRWFTDNDLHGHTLNPHDASITPGGSSGGAASAVAAGIGAIGHGTDIAGSVRYPAYACGVQGLRPSLGRVPAFNYTAADRHVGGQLMAVSGPIARSIADIRLGLQAMAAHQADDAWYVNMPLIGPDRPKKAALCVSPDGLEVAAPIEKALRDAAEQLRAAGWQVDEVDAPPLRDAAKVNIALWMADTRRYGYQAVVDENNQAARQVVEHLIQASERPDFDGLQDALQTRAALVRQWQVFLNDYAVLLCPNSGELPFADLSDTQSPEAFDRILEAQMPQCGIAVMGIPGLSVFTGKVGNTPVGIQIVAARFREDLALAAGEIIEAASPAIEPVTPQ